MMLKKTSIIHILFTCYVLLIALSFRNFLRFDATLYLGIAILPMLFLTRENKSKLSIFWLTPFWLLTLLTTSYTLMYFAIIASLVWTYSRFIGKISALPVLLLLTISPVFSYVTDVFSFDLKLKLTAFSVEILKIIASPPTSDIINPTSSTPSVYQAKMGNFQALGNIIRLPDGEEWLIDTACMGLNMLGVGLILTYFFIAFFSKKQEKLPTNQGIAVFLAAALCLNLLSNLTRIIAVVLLKIAPETVGHELIGLLSFLMYGVIPMYFFIKISRTSSFFFSENIKNDAFSAASSNASVRSFIVPIGLFLCLVVRAVFFEFYKKTETNLVLSDTLTANFTVNNLPNGVTQLRNDSTLIYLKNLQHGFTTEHSPMICWKGSGYDFQKIERITIGNIPVYIGVLQRETEQIHAIWWFESDNFATSDQIAWRYRAITEGSHFRLVNVNTVSKEGAVKAAKQWLAK
jgi:exosortase N